MAGHKRAGLLLVLLITLFCVLSCEKGESVIFFSDPFFDRIYNRDHLFENELQKSLSSISFSLDYRVIPVDRVIPGLGEFLDEIPVGTRILLSPLFDVNIDFLSKNYPDHIFYTTGKNHRQDNVYTLTIDFNSGFRSAGEALGEYLNTMNRQMDADEPPVDSDIDSDIDSDEEESEKRGHLRAGALFMPVSSEDRIAQRQFIEGFESVYQDDQLLIRTVHSMSATGMSQNQLNEFLEGSIDIVFLSGGESSKQLLSGLWDLGNVLFCGEGTFLLPPERNLFSLRIDWSVEYSRLFEFSLAEGKSEDGEDIRSISVIPFVVPGEGSNGVLMKYHENAGINQEEFNKTE